MAVYLICTKKYHRAALREVCMLIDLDPSPRSPECERLDVLATQS